MTNKTTDADIIKALECCFVNSNCNGCPQLGKSRCLQTACENAVYFINRLKAENERLDKLVVEKHKEINRLDDYMQYVKAEAIKEFAERLKEDAYPNELYVEVEDIDNLVKEMVGDTDA